METDETAEESGESLDDRQFAACDLPDRRPLYRRIDRVLAWHYRENSRLGHFVKNHPLGRFLERHLSLRHLPNECSMHVMDMYAPSPFPSNEDDGEVSRAIWDRMYAEAASLMRHDDGLNWNKFNNMVVLNGALIGGFGIAVQYNLTTLTLILPVFGTVLSWLFDFTLQEGMRCLRAHRQKIRVLDHRALPGSKPNKEFLLVTNPYNHRDALELGPLLLTFFWIVMLILVLCGLTRNVPLIK